MLHNRYVDKYLEKWKNGELVLNNKRVQLLELIEKEILPRDDIFYFDEEQINNYIEFSQAWYFELDEWEKFISAFIFLFYIEDNEVVFDEFVINMGRGGGKNGFISTLANYFVSSLHGIDYYDVSIVANSEKQAKRSFQECFRVIHKKGNEDLKEEFEAYKSSLTGLETQSVFEYKTSNASSQDGGREGAVIYDEYHEMENTDIVDVFSGGLGKVDHGRQFFIGTKGFVREGYFDIKYRECEDVLNGLTEFKGIFPYICELDAIEEMDDPDFWPKSNPALQPPLNKRGKRLFNEIMKKYKKLANEPSGRAAFVTKRMNFIEDNMENSVATKEEIMATNRPFFDLNSVPIGSFDFGSVRDFTTCGLLFKKKEEYAFKSFTYALKQFCDVHYGYSNSMNLVGTEKRAPIKKWEQDGLMKVVDEPSLSPMHVVNFFLEARKKYGVRKIVADNFKLDVIRPLLEEEGFEVIAIKNPRGIHPLLAPRVEDGFANHRFIFGDNPLMRWFTNNVYVKETQNGKQFLKKEEIKRKTDGFQAFVYSLYCANELDDQVDYDDVFDMLDDLDF
ncbi:terminase TerL endonuclease subunit [Enterococcus hirae]|uniref:terminase TerL endonuclease subunit n=1 Tax=Enterococcus hirae TaxID=1354 RepID=UPI001A072782|nr:terminase large subunit [Enterococcus hirae]EMF0058011.1 terminase large subunit [Enterococcus hirae]EMF0113354.1 terminase large subunit [Enterococcus hirae]EMF0120720.1 terminase large subunit [Enterococcus hirae]EMF0134283.1 terminase large subunit [Enterococcus hirae]